MYKKVSYLESEFISIKRSCRAVPVKEDVPVSIPNTNTKTDNVQPEPYDPSFINASTARSIAQKSRVKNDMGPIFDAIRQAANKGKNEYRTSYIPEEKKNYLIELGFYLRQDNCTYEWIISWS